MMCHSIASDSKPIVLVAGSNLPEGTIFGPVQGLDLGKGVFRPDVSPCTDIVKIRLVNGRLESSLEAWERYLPAARDVHEQNLEVCRHHDGGLYIRIRRSVSEGEPLSLWFEERYGRSLGVPYLTVDHIKGLEDYRCNGCGRRFSYPNPLKHHMMYDCKERRPRTSGTKRYSAKKSFSIDQLLYFRRKCRLGLSSNLSQITNTFSLSKLDKIRTACLSHLCTEITDTSGDLSGHGRHRCDQNEAHDRLQHKQESEEHKQKTKDFSRHGNDTDEEPMNVLHKSFIEFSTQKGHLCVYCGKFYSRKYGLKIHLRTHTGYKPLKCSVCHRAFGDPSNLNKHIRLHAQGHTPYKCKHCDKVLVRRRDLVRHLASRHPDVTNKLPGSEFSLRDGGICVRR